MFNSYFGWTKHSSQLFQFLKIFSVWIISNTIYGGAAFTLTTSMEEIYKGVLVILTEDEKKPTADEIMKELKD